MTNKKGHTVAQAASAQIIELLDSASNVLSPHMVVKAKRGAVLKAQAAAIKKELEGLDNEFKALFQASKSRALTDAKGHELVVLNHNSRNILHQPELKAAHPKLVAEFTWPSESDSVGYAK